MSRKGILDNNKPSIITIYIFTRSLRATEGKAPVSYNKLSLRATEGKAPVSYNKLSLRATEGSAAISAFSYEIASSLRSSQ
jgi:hypothetical protein